jgi:hypothetical protein
MRRLSVSDSPETVSPSSDESLGPARRRARPNTGSLRAKRVHKHLPARCASSQSARRSIRLERFYVRSIPRVREIVCALMWVEGAKQRADERAAQMDKTAAPDLAADRQQKKQRHTNRGALPAYLPRIHITVAPEHSAACHRGRSGRAARRGSGDRATLAGWVSVGAAELKAVYLRMKEILRPRSWPRRAMRRLCYSSQRPGETRSI